MHKNVHKSLIVMKALVLVLVVLFAGLSVADPPEGQYIAQGVTYVGCFEHGRDEDEEVLQDQLNGDCTFAHQESCIAPATCIDSCRSASSSYVYIGLKFPGKCYCDSLLRGVNQTDSVGWDPCDARCPGDLQQTCGGTHNMLVYQQSSVPQSTTSGGTDTTNSAGYTTKSDVEATSNEADKMSQSNTALIAGAAAGGAAVLIVAGSVIGVCIWRKKSGQRQTDKPNSTLALEDVSRHTQPSSPPYSNPAAPPTSTNIDALYAKPDKKRKQKKMSSPDDPSYQDVIPTSAQHQYATVNDDHPPNSSTQQDSNPYDSIQNDPQYAVVHKGPKYKPNVDVNPIYMGGETGVSLEQEMSGMTEMVDNVIYE